MKSRIVAALAVAILTLTACPRAQVTQHAGLPAAGAERAAQQVPARVPDLSGKVAFGVADRQTQADMREVGSGATVSLIDTATGYTLTTAVSTPQGDFDLNFSGDWFPEQDKVYYSVP